MAANKLGLGGIAHFVGLAPLGRFDADALTRLATFDGDAQLCWARSKCSTKCLGNYVAASHLRRYYFFNEGLM